jgi:vacuolar iron transporter family protein
LSRLHLENHLVRRIGWLRAAALGANDGILSTSSLIIGVAASSTEQSNILIAGVAGMIAGAMSMAAGEYVSVSSQSDTEKAELQKEKIELELVPKAELEELTQIYVNRGVDENLARTISIQLMNKDALGTHAREELGISEITTARPIEAAFTSAGTFAMGAILPLLAAILCPTDLLIPIVSIISLLVLGLLGAIGAKAGGAPMMKAIIRVVFWGAFAMGMTSAIGTLFGAAL